MALNLGELVAGLRADDAPFTRSLSRAELAMRGLTRDVNGQLRDLHGRFVRDSDAMGRSLSYGIGNGARQAVAQLARLGPAAAGLAVGLPVIAAGTTALLGLAAGAAAAGLAVKAFTMAAQPQLDAVTEATALAEEAQKAHAAGAEDAAEKQKAYADALTALPPATEATARAFIGLKKDYKGWSEEMSGTTMPVFTKGIGILRDLLPTLTPFVQAAASSIGGFLDRVAVGVKSARFKEWAADMSAAAGPALTNFLTVIKNLAVGFAGLLQAFLPASGQMTGGLVSMSAAFARWGTSLKGSEGFAQFLELAKEGGATLGQLAIAAGNLLVALGPLIGVTTQVALALARIVNSLPPGVLSVLATAIAGVVIGMKLYRAGAAGVRVANAIMASSSWAAIAGWTRMMAVGVMAYTRIAAAAVASAARTAAAWAGAALRSMATFALQMIRTAAVAVAQFAMMAARAVIWAATMAAQWLIAMGPIGWITLAVIALVALIVANWDKIKVWTLAIWNWIVQKLVWAKNMMIQAFMNFTLIGLIIKHWDTIKQKTSAAWNAVVAWLKRVPGMIYNAFLNWTPLGLIIKHWSSMKNATVNKATEIVNWVRGLPGRVKSALGNLGGILVAAGRSLIQGFINGIKGMLGSVRNAASGVVSAARDFFPFSPAKRGPFSGRGYTSYSGLALVRDFAASIDANAGLVDKSMASLMSTPTPSASMALATSAAAGPFGGAGAGVRAPRVVTLQASGGAFDEALIGTLREIDRKLGGALFQVA